MTVRSLLRWLGRALSSLLFSVLLVGIGLYLHHVWAGPPLSSWHTAHLTREFRAEDFAAGKVTTLEQYRAREAQLMDQVQALVRDRLAPAERTPFNRFSAGSRSDPYARDVNWNRTFVLDPEGAPRGGVLLLHGLSDSPYSLRSVGLHLAARGYRVVGLRLPGHGTAPSGMVDFEFEDMQAAVRLVMADLQSQLGPAAPLFIVGYSNGAALAVDYALDAREEPKLARAAGLVLISPAIGITRLAAIGRIQTGISELHGFGRAAWQQVEPEVDPYKYQSFSFHAAGATQRFTSALTARIAELSNDGPLTGLPPMLAFVSTVDSTVRASAVADSLLGRLAPSGHELVLFDVNRLSLAKPLLVDDPGPLTRRLLAESHRPYTLTLVTNADERTWQVKESRVAAGQARAVERPLDLTWPRHVFSLSHVALPFPPDDPLYGYEAEPDPRHVQLGRIEARGEVGVLAVPTWMLTRQRSNPFHAYLLERTDTFLAQAATSGTAE